MKYAIYARKSSEDDDRQALSIPAQIHEVKELVKKYGEEPPSEGDIFFEEKSARKPHRRDEFNRLVELIKEGVYDTIFCWNINRLSRNPLEGGIIQQLIVERKLRNIITPSDVVDSENCNEIIMGFLFGYSSQTSREISQNTRRGIREKIRNGGWPTSAPQFYENVGRKSKCTIIPHPDQSPYFEKWIDEIIKNRLNMRQAMRLINKWGVKTKRGNKFTPSTVEHALKNPIYCGILRYGEYEETEGNWEPLITKRKWYKLQEVLEDKAKPVTRTHMHKYNLMIKCSECGLSYTGYTITKKTGKKYTYYMCSDKLSNCSNLQLSEKQIEKQFSQAIAKVKLDEEKWGKLKKLVIQKLEKEFNFESQVRNDVDKQIDEINRKLGELLEMKLDGLVEEDDYKRKYKKLKKEVPKLKAKRTDVEITKDELRNEVELFFDKIQTLKDVFANGDYQEKRNMLFEMLEAIRIKDKVLDLNFKEPYKSVVSVGLGEKNAIWGGDTIEKFEAVSVWCAKSYKKVWVLDPAYDEAFMSFIGTVGGLPIMSVLFAGGVQLGDTVLEHVKDKQREKPYLLDSFQSALFSRRLFLKLMGLGFGVGGIMADTIIPTMFRGDELTMHARIENDFRRCMVAKGIMQMGNQIGQPTKALMIYPKGHWDDWDKKGLGFGIVDYLNNPMSLKKRADAYKLLLRAIYKGEKLKKVRNWTVDENGHWQKRQIIEL